MPQLIMHLLCFVGHTDKDQSVGQERLIQSHPYWEPQEAEATSVHLNGHTRSTEKPNLQRHQRFPLCSLLLTSKSRAGFICHSLVDMIVPDGTHDHDGAERDMQLGSARDIILTEQMRKGIISPLVSNFPFFPFGYNC